MLIPVNYNNHLNMRKCGSIDPIWGRLKEYVGFIETLKYLWNNLGNLINIKHFRFSNTAE